VIDRPAFNSLDKDTVEVDCPMPYAGDRVETVVQQAVGFRPESSELQFYYRRKIMRGLFGEY
jgi:hypothetical protein